MMRNNKSRRQFLTAVSAGVVTALAGCSGDGSDRGGEPSSEEANQDGSESTPAPTEQDQDSGETQTTGQDDPVGEDFQYEGEQAIEELILRDNNYTGPAEYLELEHTAEQINFPLDGPENYNLTADLQEETVAGRSYDAVFFFIEDSDLSNFNSGSVELTVNVAYLFSDAYDDSNEPLDQYGAEGAWADESFTVGEEGANTLFGDDITGYDDVSEDFPQEYLDLIEG